MIIPRYEENLSLKNFQEIDYYCQIVEFYDLTQKNRSVSLRDIDIWMSKMFINILKAAKIIKNSTIDYINDVIKNSILLIMDLFNYRENSDMDLENLPTEHKAEVIKDLRCII